MEVAESEESYIRKEHTTGIIPYKKPGTPIPLSIHGKNQYCTARPTFYQDYRPETFQISHD